MCISHRHSPRATVPPILCSFPKVGTDGIPFDRPENRREMVVLLDGKRLKSTLVKMPGPFSVIVSMPAHDMGVCQPSKELRELLVIRWPNDEMPVIEHQTRAQKRHRKPAVSSDEHQFKRLIVLKFFQQRRPYHGSIKHMEASSARTYTRATRHVDRLPTIYPQVILFSCDPFSFRNP